MQPVFKVQPPQVGDSWAVVDFDTRPAKPLQPFIAVCVASRGWGSYRAMASVIREVEPYPHTWCWALGMTLPEAQNECVRQALADPRVTHAWFCEDDNLQPPGCLAAMLALTETADIAATVYPLRSGEPCLIRKRDGTPAGVGLGNTLIRRDVFARLPSPAFTVSNRLWWVNDAWVDSGTPEWAGGFDMRFSKQATEAGMTIAVVEGMEGAHLQLVRGGGHVNQGVDFEVAFGGVGLPWRPEPKERGMAMVYLKAASGALVAIDPEQGGDVPHYLNNGFTEISKTQFTAESKGEAAAEKAAKAGVE